MIKKETLQIADFLIRFDFEYFDIRFEMVDHIATEMEENITNYDVFFQKGNLNREFLKYMLSKRKELDTNYHHQVKKKFWTDLLFIFKSIGKELIKIKTLF